MVDSAEQVWNFATKLLASKYLNLFLAIVGPKITASAPRPMGTAEFWCTLTHKMVGSLVCVARYYCCYLLLLMRLLLFHVKYMIITTNRLPNNKLCSPLMDAYTHTHSHAPLICCMCVRILKRCGFVLPITSAAWMVLCHLLRSPSISRSLSAAVDSYYMCNAIQFLLARCCCCCCISVVGRFSLIRFHFVWFFRRLSRCFSSAYSTYL